MTPDQAAHFQAKMQTLMKVHCLKNALTFQVPLDFSVLTPASLLTWNHMQMLLFKNHVPTNLSMCGICLPVNL